jgi:hypothetical protein
LLLRLAFIQFASETQFGSIRGWWFSGVFRFFGAQETVGSFHRYPQGEFFPIQRLVLQPMLGIETLHELICLWPRRAEAEVRALRFCLRFMVSLVEGNIHRNPLFFNGKNHGFLLRFSLEPIRWWYHPKKQNSYWYRKNFLEQNEKQKKSVHFSWYVRGLGWSTTIKISLKTLQIDCRPPILDIELKQRILLLPYMNPNYIP